MFIKQISVFIENRHGRLEEFTTLLGENGIDLIALSIADTTNFGILRAIVADNERALGLVRDHRLYRQPHRGVGRGRARLPRRPGRRVDHARDGSISIEYLYSFVRRVGKDAHHHLPRRSARKGGRIAAGKGRAPLESGGNRLIFPWS